METKRILSLLLVFSLLLSLPLLFSGCAAEGKDGKTYRLTPVLPEEAVAPVKKTYPDEDHCLSPGEAWSRGVCLPVSIPLFLRI